MKKKIFAIVFVVIPLLVYVLSFVPSHPRHSRIIYYTIPEFHTSMAGSKVGMFLAKYIGHNGRIPVGHAGIIVEDEDGNLCRYDYGRFASCFGSATLPQLQGNWVKHRMGNYKDRELNDMLPELGDQILDAFRKSGKTVNFYVMEGDSKAVVDFIEHEANDPDRYHYVWWLDHTCCGLARSAFDHGRTTKAGFLVSKVADVVGNFIPNGSSVAQTIVQRNVTAIAGVSVEGDSPLIGTSRYTYKRRSR